MVNQRALNNPHPSFLQRVSRFFLLDSVPWFSTRSTTGTRRSEDFFEASDRGFGNCRVGDYRYPRRSTNVRSGGEAISSLFLAGQGGKWVGCFLADSQSLVVVESLDGDFLSPSVTCDSVLHLHLHHLFLSSPVLSPHSFSFLSPSFFFNNFVANIINPPPSHPCLLRPPAGCTVAGISLLDALSLGRLLIWRSHRNRLPIFSCPASWQPPSTSCLAHVCAGIPFSASLAVSFLPLLDTRRLTCGSSPI